MRCEVVTDIERLCKADSRKKDHAWSDGDVIRRRCRYQLELATP